MVSSFDGTGEGLMRLDNGKAVRAGLTLRPLEETLRGTVDWWQREKDGSVPKAGLSEERESEILRDAKSNAPPV
jgi:2'-hydroxyisoflavone reductase